MIIYLSRHPQTQWNLDKKIQGHLDSPLTDLGRKTAERLADLLKDKKIEKIYSSDLGRCKQTSEIINVLLNKEIIYSKKLRERNFGDYNSKPKDLIKDNFDLNDFDLVAPNGESDRQLKDRINIYFEKLIKSCKENVILIITHDGGVKSILSEVLNLEFSDPKSSIKQGNIAKLIFENNKIILDEIIT